MQPLYGTEQQTLNLHHVPPPLQSLLPLPHCPLPLKMAYTNSIIPCPPSGYTIVYLKNVAGQAKMYIRQLQKDLDLSPVANSIKYVYTRGKERDRVSSSYLLSQLLLPAALSPRSVPKLWINCTAQPAS